MPLLSVARSNVICLHKSSKVRYERKVPQTAQASLGSLTNCKQLRHVVLAVIPKGVHGLSKHAMKGATSLQKTLLLITSAPVELRYLLTHAKCQLSKLRLTSQRLIALSLASTMDIAWALRLTALWVCERVSRSAPTHKQNDDSIKHGCLMLRKEGLGLRN